MQNWCDKWLLKVNLSKSNVMHFRRKRARKTTYNFHMYGKTVDLVAKYKYLGVIFDEYLEYKENADVLASSGGRALGAVINKFKTVKNIGFQTFTCLYESGVLPILQYCSGVWGGKDFEELDRVQNRAIRYFLGIHSKAPIPGLRGDMRLRSRKYRNLFVL